MEDDHDNIYHLPYSVACKQFPPIIGSNSVFCAAKEPIFRFRQWMPGKRISYYWDICPDCYLLANGKEYDIKYEIKFDAKHIENENISIRERKRLYRVIKRNKLIKDWNKSTLGDECKITYVDRKTEFYLVGRASLEKWNKVLASFCDDENTDDVYRIVFGSVIHSFNKVYKGYFEMLKSMYMMMSQGRFYTSIEQ